MNNEIRPNNIYQNNSTVHLFSKCIEKPTFADRKKIHGDFKEEIENKVGYINALMRNKHFMYYVYPNNINEERRDARKNRSTHQRFKTVKKRTALEMFKQSVDNKNVSTFSNDKTSEKAHKSGKLTKTNITMASSNSKRNCLASTTAEPNFLNFSSMTKIFQSVDEKNKTTENQIVRKIKFPTIDKKKQIMENIYEPNFLLTNHKDKDSLNLIPFLTKEENPNLHKLLVENKSGKLSRRIAASLSNSEEMDLFTKLVKEKTEWQLKYRYSLIPNQKVDMIIPQGSPLINIADKCTREIKFAEEIDRILDKEKSKEILNNVEKYNNELINIRKKQDQMIIEDGTDKNIAKSLNEKVFLYDEKGEGKFVSSQAALTQIEKMDLVSKISEKLAYNNRNKYINHFGYNYHGDQEFLFLDEIEKRSKIQEEQEKKTNEEKKKGNRYKEIDDCLESTKKGKAYLISKVARDLRRIYNKYERPYGNNEGVHEVSSIFTDQLSTFYGKMPKMRTRSMIDIRKEVFNSLDNASKQANFKF